MARVEWTISNVLSCVRVVLLVPILYFLLKLNNGDRGIAAGLMLVAALTDFLDGQIARRLHQETELGRIIDPLADKICAGAVVIALVSLGDVPFWFLPMVIGRDALILLGGIYIANTKKTVYHSNWAGKAAMAIVATYFVVATLKMKSLGDIQTVLLWLSAASLTVSFILYCKRFYNAVLAKRQLAAPSE
jgi:CDP-diacylglycerol--glycerol-3-phosphate 3-phosphatidyltransferase